MNNDSKTSSLSYLVPGSPWAPVSNIIALMLEYHTTPDTWKHPPDGLTDDHGMKWDRSVQVSFRMHVEELRAARKRTSKAGTKDPKFGFWTSTSDMSASLSDYVNELELARPVPIDESILLGDPAGRTAVFAPFLLEPHVHPAIWTGALDDASISGPNSEQAKKLATQVSYIYSRAHHADMLEMWPADKALLDGLPLEMKKVLEAVAMNNVAQDWKWLHRLQCPIFEAVSQIPLLQALLDAAPRARPPVPASVIENITSLLDSLRRQLEYLAPYLGYSVGLWLTQKCTTREGKGVAIPIPLKLYEVLEFATASSARVRKQGDLNMVLGLLLSSVYGVRADAPVSALTDLADTDLDRIDLTRCSLADWCTFFDALDKARGASMLHLARKMWGPPKSGTGIELLMDEVPIAYTDGLFASASIENLVAGTRCVLPLLSENCTLADGVKEQLIWGKWAILPTPRIISRDEKFRSWGLPPGVMPMNSFMGEPDCIELSGRHLLASIKYWRGNNMSRRLIIGALAARWPDQPGIPWYGTPDPVATDWQTEEDVNGRIVTGPLQNAMALAPPGASKATKVEDLIAMTRYMKFRDSAGGQSFLSRTLVRRTHPTSYRLLDGVVYSGQSLDSIWYRNFPEDGENPPQLETPLESAVINLLTAVGLA